VTVLDDRRRLGQLSQYMCHNLREAGSVQEALTYGRSAQAIAESLTDQPLWVTANINLGATCVYAGDYRRADDHLQRVLRWLSGDRSRERFGQAGFPAVVAHAYLTWSAADQGAFSNGIHHGEVGIRLAESVDHPFSRIFAGWVLGYLHIARGEPERAVDLLERGLALSRDWNVTLFSVLGSGLLGYAYALAGRSGDGLPLLDQALAAMHVMGYRGHEPLFLGHLAEAYLLEDRLDDALELAQRALTRARERGRRPYEARALRLLGEIASRRQSSAAQADAYDSDALALAEELGLRPLAAHCHLGLAKRRAGVAQGQRANEHLIAAVSAYRSMDMHRWLTQAEIAMAEPHGPVSSGGA
jgi:tetratricopeptide (TPR) repeat protein